MEKITGQFVNADLGNANLAWGELMAEWRISVDDLSLFWLTDLVLINRPVFLVFTTMSGIQDWLWPVARVVQGTLHTRTFLHQSRQECFTRFDFKYNWQGCLTDELLSFHGPALWEGDTPVVVQNLSTTDILASPASYGVLLNSLPCPAVRVLCSAIKQDLRRTICLSYTISGLILFEIHKTFMAQGVMFRSSGRRS